MTCGWRKAQEALGAVGWKSVFGAGATWRAALGEGLGCAGGLREANWARGRQDHAHSSSYEGGLELEVDNNTSRQGEWLTLSQRNIAENSGYQGSQAGWETGVIDVGNDHLHIRPSMPAKKTGFNGKDAISGGSWDSEGSHRRAETTANIPLYPFEAKRGPGLRHTSGQYASRTGLREVPRIPRTMLAEEDLAMGHEEDEVEPCQDSHDPDGQGNERQRRYFNPSGLSYYLWQKQQRDSPVPVAAALQDLKEQNTRNPRLFNKEILPYIADTGVLECAFLSMYSRHGSLEEAQEQLDTFARDWLPRVSRKLLQGSYTFPAPIQLEPRQRLRGGGARLVPVWWHRTVPEAMRMVLEAVFDPGFSRCVHGFRPQRGCHSALKEVKDNFGGVDYFLEVDLTGCLGEFNKSTLLQAVSEKIGDEQFLSLLNRAHRAGIVNLEGANYKSIGIPQVSLISPIMCNVYLQKLDRWMEDLMRVLEVGRMHPGSEDGYAALAVRERWVSELLRFADCWQAPSLTGIRYVRYGANFLVGVNGTRRDCHNLEQDLRAFFSSTLKLQHKKATASTACASTPDKEYTVFLGAEIYVAQQIGPPGSDPGSKEAGKLLQCPRVCIPARLLLAKLEDHGFTHKTKKKPTFCGRLVNWEAHEIVKFYDITFRMFMAYYTFADNYHCLSLLFDILRQSCALSLGKKLSLKRIWWVTKRFGKDLVIKGDGDVVLAAMYKPKFDKPRVPFPGRDVNPFTRLERPAKPRFHQLEGEAKPGEKG
ncbi:unnamed protein product [Ostreobium quekettii]|uniref:Reverse transcriptase domain-containing protein n=1 Tax=Ostreobium quekettii TaxID=121088 RepID=A0A8S1JG77_9CHLO|nr:unnamed protein product [Ostreobium quekettii]|eukprot:evm.model.scf_78.4 EVM.evm.TU.scf_78.4   scf_78:107429-110073(-)